MDAEGNDSRRSPAPDGRWGWLVVIASFFIQMVSMGTTLSFGVVFTDLLEYFDASEASVSWIGSIQPAILYLTGLLVAPLKGKLGWRAMGMLGSVLSAVGFSLSSLVPNIYYLYVSYGLLTGIGNGFMYMTSLIVVQHYFEKKRGMATGIVVAGSALGTSVFGILNRKLIDALGWRMAFLTLGAISLSCSVFSLLYLPLAPITPEHTKEERDCLVSDDSHKTYGSIDPSETKISMRAPVSPKHQDFKSYSNFKNAFDCSLCKNPIFVLYTLAIMLFFFGYHVPYTYMPVRAIREFSIDSRKASYLVSIMGIGNVLSRLLLSVFADFSKKVRYFMSGSVLLLGGAISMAIYWINTYTYMIIYCVFFGIFTGCRACLLPVVLVDLLGIELVDKAIGLSFAAASFSFLFASPLAGFIIQQTDSFEIAIMVSGGTGILSGIFFFCILCLPTRQLRVTLTVLDVQPGPKECDKGPP